MSALNHAFLRAYAKRSASEQVDAPPPVTVVEPAAPTVVEDEAPLPRAPRFGAMGAVLPAAYPNRLRVDGAHPTPKPMALRVESVAPRFRPAWEVDQFPCPSICGMVLDRTAADLDRVGAEFLRFRELGMRVLGLTSATRHEGRTTLSICLARAAAAQGLRVILLDADLDQPRLASAMGVDVQQDWTTVISGSLPIEEVAVASLAESLTLIPLVPGTAGRGNLLRLGQFALFVDQLTTLADLVVVDLPPLEGHGLPGTRSGFASPVDGVIMVRDLRRTSDELLSASVDEINQGGLTVVGVIENFV